MHYLDAFYGVIIARTKGDSAKRLALAAVLLLALFTVCGYYSAVTRIYWTSGDPTKMAVRGLPLWLSWAIIGGGIVIFFALLGLHVQDRIGGTLINERNLMSLSRLQILAWTVLIVSGFGAIALFRVFTPTIDDPLGIDIPSQLWQLLGISAGSTLLTGLVHAQKATKPVHSPKVIAERTAEQLNAKAAHPVTTEQEVEEARRGALYANPSPSDARFTDIFEGDDLGNTAFIDIAKVQMFLFTIIALIAYGSALFALMEGTSAQNLASLPEVTPGLVTILGISHATYIGGKTLSHN